MVAAVPWSMRLIICIVILHSRQHLLLPGALSEHRTASQWQTTSCVNPSREPSIRAGVSKRWRACLQTCTHTGHDLSSECARSFVCCSIRLLGFAGVALRQVAGSDVQACTIPQRGASSNSPFTGRKCSAAQPSVTGNLVGWIEFQSSAILQALQGRGRPKCRQTQETRLTTCSHISQKLRNLTVLWIVSAGRCAIGFGPPGCWKGGAIRALPDIRGLRE